MLSMDVQKIIIIHPGSQNLRIGRASDLNPLTILHAIARKKRDAASQKAYHDHLLPKLVERNENLQEFEEQRLIVTHGIQAYVSPTEENARGAKRLRIATPPQQIATFNRRSVPEVIEDSGAVGNESVETTVKLENIGNTFNECLFDQDILKLSADEANDYHIHFPMHRGEFNLHSGIGGSLTAVIANLETIWSYALQQRLRIPREKLQFYSVVLVIPNIYNRSHLRELVTLLLQRLHFRSCFLLQDDVAATFGSGLSYACVVDAGDQKCSISCVEDGISQTDTRVRLEYGGGDVTQVFQTLLRKWSFPYKECDYLGDDYVDAALLQTLKERFCHINLEVCGAQEKTFEVKRGKVKRLRYTLQLGDECIVAPCSFFHTELMNLTGKNKRACLQQRSGQQPDAEDCFDADYIRETGRRNGRDQEGSIMPVTGDVGDDDLNVVDPYDAAEREAQAKNSDKEEQMYYTANGQILSLEQAIIRSIERCPSDEMKRKMYGCILLVGGSSKFAEFAKYLEQKLRLALSLSGNRGFDQMPYELNVFKKEMDAAIIAWKGAAIMSCLESAPELWIYQVEWEKYGLRVLREKAPFMW